MTSEEDKVETEEKIVMTEDKINVMDSMDGNVESVILHLRDLVACYEDLVQDMTQTIHKTKEDFDVCQKELGKEIAMAGSPCESCKDSDQLVDNLKRQVDTLANGKKMVTALWHASAEQIEQLESRLKSKSITTNDIQSKTSTDSQVKFLQDYIIRLEGRIEQTSSEKKFYRQKLMESKLENETVMKRLSYEKQKDIEVVKSTYLKEIEHLKLLLERERTFLQSEMEKKMEEERKIWVRQEKERRENLKKSWIVQLEPIVVEQEAVFVRETQLSDKLRQTQLELFQAKQILLLYQQQETQLQTARSVTFTEKQTGQLKRGSSSSNLKSLGGRGEEFVVDKYEQQIGFEMRTCHHEECVKYSMYQKVLHENERLGEEIDRMKRSKQVFEKEYEQHALRLEQRIRDLENLNYKLQSQFLNQHYVQHRENIFKIKSGGDGDVEDGRLVEATFSEPVYSTPVQANRAFITSFGGGGVETIPPNLDIHLKTTNNNNNSTIEQLERFSRDLLLRNKVNEQKWLMREQSLVSKLQANKDEDSRTVLF